MDELTVGTKVFALIDMNAWGGAGSAVPGLITFSSAREQFGLAPEKWRVPLR